MYYAFRSIREGEGLTFALGPLTTFPPLQPGPMAGLVGGANVGGAEVFLAPAAIEDEGGGGICGRGPTFNPGLQ